MTTDTLNLYDTEADAPATPAPNDARFAARNRIVINTLLVSTFVVMLNETAMSVALPPLMEAFNAPATDVQWLTTAFLLVMAVVIPVTGFLLQVLNTRPIFLIAMTLFTIGTLIAALAPNLGVLIAARVVQATGTAIMMPLLMTTVMTLVAPHERGKTMGSISIVMSVAPAIGPAFAGFVIAHLDWRWIFILVLPIALGAIALGYRMMVNVTTPRPAPLDVGSVILSALGFGGIVYGLSGLGHEGAGTIPAWIPLAIGVVTMVAFVLRQLQLQRADRALLDLRTLRSKNYTISMAMIAVLMMAMFGVIILLPIYLVQVTGLDTLGTGLLLMPGALLMGVLGPFVGRLYDRVGPSPLIIPAMVVVSAVLWSLTLLTATTPWQAILIGHIVISLGFAFLFGPLFTTSLGSVPSNLYSHGSALLGSVQQVAGAAGVALFVSLMTVQSKALTAGGASSAEALTGGLRVAFMVGAVISLVALAASFFVRRAEGGPEGGHIGH
ncbi:MAG TPA: MDR family MFS transporter [Devosia sp.]|nr:MDR family MFS transporter [Devosia sp.]